MKMTRIDLIIKIERRKASYDFLVDKLHRYSQSFTHEDYTNNTKNNCLDSLTLLNNGVAVYTNNNIQTVANYPLCHVKDTVKAGKFQIKCLQEPGAYFEDKHNPGRIKIHHIINTEDLENQIINGQAMQNDLGNLKGRWLIHSTYYPPLNKDTKAYSQGCFIFKNTDDLVRFNSILIANNINPGDVISGELIDID
jgi:hypothetical protein